MLDNVFIQFVKEHVNEHNSIQEIEYLKLSSKKII